MPQFRYECFCRLTYDEELTYEELIEYEASLMEEMQDLLEEVGAVHVDFFPTGDALQVQWVLAKQEAGDFDRLTASLAELVGSNVNGRVLRVDKEFDDLRMGLVGSGRWKVVSLDLPIPLP